MVIKHIMKQVIPLLPTLFCPLASSLPLSSSSSLSLSPLPSHHLSSPSSTPLLFSLFCPFSSLLHLPFLSYPSSSFFLPLPSSPHSSLPSSSQLSTNTSVVAQPHLRLLPVFRKCLNQMLNLYAGEQNITHIHHHTGVHVPHTLVTMCLYVTFPRWSNTSPKGKRCFVWRM